MLTFSLRHGHYDYKLNATLREHVAWKLVWRWRFLRKLRTARISPQQLKEMLDEGQQPLVADLRQRLDLQRDPYVIPGALVLSVEDLEARHQELPRDRDIILYCS